MGSLRRIAKDVSNRFPSLLHLQELHQPGRWKKGQISCSKGYLLADSLITRFFISSIAPGSRPNSTHSANSSAAHLKGSNSKHGTGSMPATPLPDSSNNSWADIITQHTQATRDHLTPEIELRLITHYPLWHETTDQCPFTDPFWAFYWPGGQALTRFILDHPGLIKGKTVLDVGSGCGASAIAACMAGASRVLANDIDPVAVQAINLNAALNGITLDTSAENLLSKPCLEDNPWDLVFLGDMFYDRDFTNVVADWLIGLIKTHNSRVLIGDPGRVYLRDHPMRQNLIKLFEIELPPSCVEENRGHSTGYVWQFVLF